MDAEEKSADCETVVDAEVNSADCETACGFIGEQC